MPSWRFFDRIGPAPRIECSLAATAAETGREWRELRPRPARVPIAATIARLFWNPRRNESLFVVSCAERLLEEPTRERASLLWTRVADAVRADLAGSNSSTYLRIRIIEVTRQGEALADDVMYVSEPGRL